MLEVITPQKWVKLETGIRYGFLVGEKPRKTEINISLVRLKSISTIKLKSKIEYRNVFPRLSPDYAR